jgi:hypothetical protein
VDGEKTVYTTALPTLTDIPTPGSQAVTVSGLFQSIVMENNNGVLTYVGQHGAVYRTSLLGNTQADQIADVVRGTGNYVYQLVVPDGATPRGLVTITPFQETPGVWKALQTVTQM